MAGVGWQGVGGVGAGLGERGSVGVREGREMSREMVRDERENKEEERERRKETVMQEREIKEEERERDERVCGSHNVTSVFNCHMSYLTINLTVLSRE